MDLASHLDPDTIQKLQSGGYALMLMLMVIEWPIVTFIASFLASLGWFSFPVVLLLGWMGDIGGDMLYFCIGHYGSRAFQKFQNKSAEKNSEFLQKLERLVKTNLFLSIFVVKFTPYVQPIGLTLIGKLNPPVRKYALYSAILCVPIPFVFGMTGYHLGQINNAIMRASKENIFLASIWAVAVILICVGIFWYLRRKSKEALVSPETGSGKSALH